MVKFRSFSIFLLVFLFFIWLMNQASSVIIRCITNIFHVSPFSILTVADDGSKQRYINNEYWSDRKTWIPGKYFFLQKRHYNCEKLNTRSHAKFPASILKNPYYTPCNTAHIITPSCNTDQVITPPGAMTCCVSNLWHMQN
jgi:hypothetical protein